MKRHLTIVVTFLVIFSLAGFLFAKDKLPKPGKMAGTWECTSHGSSQGDMPFTLYLEHMGEAITGSVSSPLGGTDITSGLFKKKNLEIRLETPNGTYVLSAKLRKGQLSGQWSHDAGESGTWEGKKQIIANK